MTLFSFEPSRCVQVLVAGASSEYCVNGKSPAGKNSWIFDVSPGANHSLIEEEMAFGRVVSRAACTNLLSFV